MHEYIPVVITLVAILAGILMNRADVHQLRSEIKDVRNELQSLRAETRAEIKDVRNELQSLRAEMNHHFERIDERFERVNDSFNAVDERFTKVDYALMQFFSITGKQEGRIDEIAKAANREPNQRLAAVNAGSMPAYASFLTFLLPAGDTLFTSGTLGRYSAMLTDLQDFEARKLPVIDQQAAD